MFGQAVVQTQEALGICVRGGYATEAARSSFPRLPVREGEHGVLAMAMFDTTAAPAAFDARAIEPPLQSWLVRPIEALRLAPTARSAPHA